MQGIISLGKNFEKRIEIIIENNQVIDYTIKEFDHYLFVSSIDKPFFLALDKTGQREFKEGEFEQFLIDNDKLIDLFNDINLIYQTTESPAIDDRKIKRSIDFFESQILDLKRIKDGNVSALVREAVDEYIDNYK